MSGDKTYRVGASGNRQKASAEGNHRQEIAHPQSSCRGQKALSHKGDSRGKFYESVR